MHEIPHPNEPCSRGSVKFCEAYPGAAIARLATAAANRLLPR